MYQAPSNKINKPLAMKTKKIRKHTQKKNALPTLITMNICFSFQMHKLVCIISRSINILCFISNIAIGPLLIIFPTFDGHCFWLLIFGKKRICICYLAFWSFYSNTKNFYNVLANMAFSAGQFSRPLSMGGYRSYSE
jgi:hypothetical protein